ADRDGRVLRDSPSLAKETQAAEHALREEVLRRGCGLGAAPCGAPRWVDSQDPWYSSGSNTGIPWGWPSRAKAAMMEENIAAGEALQPRRLRVVMVIQRFRQYFSGHGVQVELLSREFVRRGAEATVVAAICSGDALL